MKTCLALRHLGFEDLGSFAAGLADADYAIRYVDTPVDSLAAIDPLAADLVIVLGGPVGAYETARYPFLGDELGFLALRLAADRPTLGLCLSAQLIAAAAGAAVYPGPVKEIGFAAVELTLEGRTVLAALDGVAVLHWHGDSFDLPPGATRLAGTAAYANQAFTLGHALGLQFHAEVDPARFELWLAGHAGELAAAGIDPAALRRDAARHGGALVAAGRAMLTHWLATVAT